MAARGSRVISSRRAEVDGKPIFFKKPRPARMHGAVVPKHAQFTHTHAHTHAKRKERRDHRNKQRTPGGQRHDNRKRTCRAATKHARAREGGPGRGGK